MGAGKGKSRVTAAIAYHILTLSEEDEEVHVVFSHEELKDRDYNSYNFLWAFLEASNKKLLKRLHYQSDLKKFPTLKSKKKCIVVIDEGDEVILKDIKDFYAKTKGENIRVICLTATADDGDKEGVESQAFTRLGFKTY